MEDVFDRLIAAHRLYSERTLRGRMYDYSAFCKAECRHLDGGVFSQAGSFRTIAGHEVMALACGNGQHRVLAWSQMHGNEPVSTLALMDVMNFLESGDAIARQILAQAKIVCIPLLNPEGHIANCRRNSQGIDINRDALDLASPEAEFLSGMHGAFCPHYALNLHDQELYHITMPQRRQTLVSLLAPECDEAGSLTPARIRAMKVAGYTAARLECSAMAAGRVARYQDLFTPTAFGDTFMSKGTSSVLIEAGSVPRDPERIAARKAVYASIILSLRAICGHQDDEDSLAAYNMLPLNIYNTSFDLMIRGLEVQAPSRQYKVDVGIRRVKAPGCDEDFTDGTCDFRIVNIGNLSSMAGIVDFDAAGCRLSGSYSQLRVGAKADFMITDGSNAFNVKKLLNKLLTDGQQ